MSIKEKSYDALIKELENVANEHANIEIDALNIKAVRNLYQKLRYRITELVGVFTIRKYEKFDLLLNGKLFASGYDLSKERMEDLVKWLNEREEKAERKDRFSFF